MKKLMVVAVGVLVSTLAFAKSTDEPVSGSSVRITNSGSASVKLFYKSSKSNNVMVSIVNEKDEVMFSEIVKKTEGFIRPYNLSYLPEGEYTIRISDENGTQIEKITCGVAKIEKSINIVKVQSEEGRYLLTGFSTGADRINIRIYNSDGKSAYEETLHVNGSFAQLYNLKDLNDSFSIEVSDASGTLKNFSK